MGIALGKIASLFVEIGANSDAARAELSRIGNDLNSYGNNLARTGAVMTAGISVPLVLLGKSAVNLSRDYQEQMNVLGSVSKASGEEMKNLGELAQTLGADLTLPATSAADAAEAMVELGKAGLSVNDIYGAARGVLELSAAGNLSNAAAAEIASNALNAFKLSGDQAVRVADLLAAAANSSSAEVNDMADSFKMSAAVASSANIPIEDLATAMALMANQGIKGSDAGTSWKQMILSIQAPTDKAKALMQDLGISIYDANGSMLEQREIIGNFTEKLGIMSDEQRNAALATIFGSDAVRAANIVLMSGTDAWDDMAVKVGELGAAGELASARLKGLPGSLDRMKSSIETAQLALGNAASGPISDLADIVTNLANSFADLNPETQETIVKIGLVAIAAGPTLTVLGGVLKVAGGLQKAFYVANIATLGLRTGMSLTASLGAAGLSSLTIGLGAVGLAVASVVGVWVAWNKNIRDTNQAGKEAIDSTWSDFFAKQVEDGKSAIEIADAYTAAQQRMREQMTMQATTDASGGIGFKFEEIAKLFILNKDNLVNASEQASQAILVASDSYVEYANAMLDAGLTQQQVTMQEWEAYQALQNTAGGVDALSGSYENYSRMMDDFDLSQSKMTEEMFNTVAGIEAVVGETGGLETVLGNVSTLMSEYTTELLFNQAAAGLDADASIALAAKMGLIDEATLSAMTKLEDLRNQMDEGAISAEEYYGEVDSLADIIAEMQSKNIDITVNHIDTYTKIYYETREDLNRANTGGDNSPGGVQQANGGDWLVKEPTWFLAGEAGWERATFEPIGKSGSSSGDTPSIQFNIGSVRKDGDIFKLAQQVAEVIRRERL